MDNLTGRPKLHLLDISALVVGYGLASMLVRAYWPESSTPSFWELGFMSIAFVWLGMAMAGPVVLLIRRPPQLPPDTDGNERPPEPRSWAELAWIVIGAYWIGLTVLVVPARMPGTVFLDSAFLGMFPFLAVIAFRFFGPRTMWGSRDDPSWTQRAGVVLVMTWPFAWVALIVLGKALL